MIIHMIKGNKLYSKHLSITINYSCLFRVTRCYSWCCSL